MNVTNGGSKVLEIMVRISALCWPVVLALGGFLVKLEMDQAERLTKLESLNDSGQKFTATDAERLRREILQDIDSRFPPVWLRDDVTDLRVDVKTLQALVTRLRIGMDATGDTRNE